MALTLSFKVINTLEWLLKLSSFLIMFAQFGACVNLKSANEACL